MLAGLDATEQVSVGTGAADAGEQARHTAPGLPLHGLGVEAFIFGYAKAALFNFAGLHLDVQDGRAFNLGNFFGKGEVEGVHTR